MDVATALNTRRSVRAFLETPVERDVLRSIFARAQRAPSWCNVQPWRVAVFSGDARVALTSALVKAATGDAPSPDFAWPGEYPEPYATHRRECGKALYSAMEIERHDKEARSDAWLRNFSAFGAPHVVLVGVDRRLGFYAGLDLGCWLESVLLVATELGVATCPQAALALYADAVRPFLPWDEHVGVVFGIAMGYEDAAARANRCITSRAELDENVTFLG